MLKIGGHEIRIRGRLLRVAQLEGDGYEFLDDPEAMLRELRASGHKIDLFTFTQRLPETTPKYAYPMEWDNFAAVEITTFDSWWNHQIGFKARNKAKQAGKKGVVIREVPFGDDLVQGIREIYNETPIRQGRRFPHYAKDLQTVYREEATFLDRSVFIGAFFEEKLIGFIKLVADETNTQAGLMNILSMIRHRDKAPTNALFAQAVRSSAERNISYMVYSQFAYGSKEHSTLSDFKERNGMRRIDIPRYYVPLTLAGGAAFRLGLHKSITDRIPSTILNPLRELRSAFYNKRSPLSEESA